MRTDKRFGGVALAVALVFVWPGAARAEMPSKRRPTTVETRLLEFKIKPKPKNARAGKVAFRAKNVGGIHHEVIVVRSQPGGRLPTLGDGSVDESQIPATDKFGEIKNLAEKKSTTLRVKNLPVGNYTLFCNIVDAQPDGSVLSHYAKGMTVGFAVT
jgi:uncharacterized cupredoxin-like copper-binding protein